MNWQAKIFRYCERGSDGTFWAEPANAISNGAFIVAAFSDHGKTHLRRYVR